jgi:tripartite-type tricarboxylate transporter receptor subunit TctC
VRVLVQYSEERHPAFPNVPTMVELAKNPADRQIMALYGSIADVGRALILPPDVPADRLAAYRDAFDKMLADPEFLAETKQAKLEIEPVSGAEFQKRIAQTLDVPDAVRARATKLRE